MHGVRRSATSYARRARPSLTRRHPRRYARDAHDTTHHAPHHGPVNEPLGPAFYITLALLPTSYLLYRLSSTADPAATPPLLTRLIDRFRTQQARFAERNALHTAIVEQAAAERHLFMASRGSNTVELKFPEIFNTGSPHNVPAGQGGANLDRLIAHYQKLNREEEERKWRRLEETGWKPERVVERRAPLAKIPPIA